MEARDPAMRSLRNVINLLSVATLGRGDLVGFRTLGSGDLSDPTVFSRCCSCSGCNGGCEKSKKESLFLFRPLPDQDCCGYCDALEKPAALDHGRSSAEHSVYRAAVVEFSPRLTETWQTIDAPSASAMKLENLARLEAYAARAKQKGTQIIAFPEYGITGYMDFNRSTVQPWLEELPSTSVNPCEEALSQAPAIARASCVAKKLRLVLVIDLLTRDPCAAGDADACPADGMRVHNTAIALSEAGTILAVYHKRHLWFSEQGFADPGGESMKNGVTFTTSFGVKFGMFICFDLLFFGPDDGPDAREIIFPTDWTNKLWIDNVRVPVPSALQAEREWSMMEHKNLIAANYGGQGKQSSGSGIWHEGSPLQSFFNPTSKGQDRLLVADVPVLRRRSRSGNADADDDDDDDGATDATAVERSSSPSEAPSLARDQELPFPFQEEQPQPEEPATGDTGDFDFEDPGAFDDDWTGDRALALAPGSSEPEDAFDFGGAAGASPYGWGDFGLARLLSARATSPRSGRASALLAFPAGVLLAFAALRLRPAAPRAAPEVPLLTA